ncbi:MAG: Na(+)-translocating NADH-quinone reductase subunit A [Planctomycetaceae bacterium]|nr:Na(+)-translocating NADH-quinone reductase subunit A [Planctomycetaceae bacterium]
MHRITRGLDLPIEGVPPLEVEPAPPVRTVALIGDDYVGMKPAMAVAEGDRVQLGQVLFTDRKTPGVNYTSPGSGTVQAINRGARRAFQSIVIALDGDGEVEFRSWRDSDLTTLSREDVRENLLASGLWTALRQRPFGKVPSPERVPRSLFVTAMDTRPLAADPVPLIRENETAFIHGLQILKHLTDGPVYLCHAAGQVIPGHNLPGIQAEAFDGPHPAGLPGTHIHLLDPVSDRRFVWHIDAQDVIAVGRLFTTGRLPVERVVAVGGPGIAKPTVLRTRLGASTEDLTAGRLADGINRVISGSVLSGRTAAGVHAWLGRYHAQISALPEGTEREFLGWQMPGGNKFSIKRVYSSTLSGAGRLFRFTTSQEGSRRAMVPLGMYEAVMPLDIEPTFLLRSLIIRDTEQAQQLGCLELDEEDLGLCTFVCPGKYEYGPILRDNLTRIEKEG